jgi:hypothetical protein
VFCTLDLRGVITFDSFEVGFLPDVDGPIRAEADGAVMRKFGGVDDYSELSRCDERSEKD